MTFIASWLDEAAYMIADSAVTHTGSLHSELSTFGEASVRRAGTVVEEGAFKMVALSAGILVGLGGDVPHATGFLGLVTEDVQREGDVQLPNILERLRPAARDREHFQLVFLHHYEGRSNHITAFDSRLGIRRYDATPNGIVRSSSELPDATQRRFLHALNAIRGLPVPADVRFHVGLAFAQGMGLSDHLLQYGVGGAFFGATADRGSIRWQHDVLHLELAPDVLVARNHQQEIPAGDLALVRVGVRDGVGFVHTSIGERSQVYRPVTAKSVSPIAPSLPRRIVAPVRYVAIHHRLHRRMMVLDRGEETLTCSFLQLTAGADLVGLHWEPAVAALLERPTAAGRYEVYCAETGVGGRGTWGPVTFDLEPTSEFVIE